MHWCLFSAGLKRDGISEAKPQRWGPELRKGKGKMAKGLVEEDGHGRKETPTRLRPRR